MAIRIIIPGDIQPITYQTICTKCSCKFEFNDSDIEVDRLDSYVKCPTPKCNMLIWITDKNKLIVKPSTDPTLYYNK